MQEPPGPAFERYLAQVDQDHPPYPRYQPGPARWWHPLPVVLTLGGLVGLAAWKIGQAVGAW